MNIQELSPLWAVLLNTILLITILYLSFFRKGSSAEVNNRLNTLQKTANENGKKIAALQTLLEEKLNQERKR